MIILSRYKSRWLKGYKMNRNRKSFKKLLYNIPNCTIIPFLAQCMYYYIPSKEYWVGLLMLLLLFYLRMYFFLEAYWGKNWTLFTHFCFALYFEIMRCCSTQRCSILDFNRPFQNIPRFELINDESRGFLVKI